MADYQGKKVVIIGLGMTGLSCVDFFMARGVTPRVMDTRVAPSGLEKLPEEVERYVGGLNEDWLLAADLIVASPGIALAHPALSEGWASAIPGLATIRSAASSQVSLSPPTWHSTDSGNLSSPGGATRVSITRGVTPRAMKKSTHDRPVIPSPIMTTFLP